MDKKLTLDVCMIVKNEEENLKMTLPNMVAACDHVIVVDTGSSDNTREVARSLGAELHEFKWIDDFAAARNASLAYSGADWIIWLDADEYVEIGDLEKLRTYLSTASANVIMLQVHNCPHGTTNSAGFFYRDKLFRNLPGSHFERAINEAPVIPENKVPAGYFDEFSIFHWGVYPTKERIDKKNQERIALYKSAIEKDGSDLAFHYLLAHKYLAVDRTDEAIFEYEQAIKAFKFNKDISIKEAAHVSLAGIYNSRGMYKEAAEHSLAAMETNSNIIDTYCYLAVYHTELGNHETALEILKSAVELPKKAHMVLIQKDLFWDYLRVYQYGMSLLRFNRLEEARPQLQKAFNYKRDDENLKNILDKLNEVLGSTGSSSK